MVALDPADGIGFSFTDPLNLSPYRVIKINGFDGGLLKPRYYRGNLGEKFYDIKPDPRDIIFTMGLNPDYSEDQTISDLRDNLYRVVGISKSGRVDIHFEDGLDVVAVLSGFVSKVEYNPFEKDPSIDLTINCEDPILRSPLPVIMDVSGADLSDWLVDDGLSTAPHGFTFQLEITSAIEYLTIVGGSGSLFTIQPTDGFTAGEILTFSNEYGTKQLNTDVRNVLGKVLPGSIWPIIFPGENTLSFTDSPSLNLLEFSYHRAYWGV